MSPWAFGLNEGPIILMIENFQLGAGLEEYPEMSLYRTGPFVAQAFAMAGLAMDNFKLTEMRLDP